MKTKNWLSAIVHSGNAGKDTPSRSVCFMINGNMCVGPWDGSLIVRLHKQKHEETQSEPHVKPMGIESDDDLTSWVCRAVKFVAPHPAK